MHILFRLCEDDPDLFSFLLIPKKEMLNLLYELSPNLKILTLEKIYLQLSSKSSQFGKVNVCSLFLVFFPFNQLKKKKISFF